jgi:hypothetical protein
MRTPTQTRLKYLTIYISNRRTLTEPSRVHFVHDREIYWWCAHLPDITSVVRLHKYHNIFGGSKQKN